MRPVKLGIIGCGIAARKLHWPALQQMADKFEITAVCNHTEAKAKSFAELAGGVPYVLDYRELLKREEVEAVDIILPIHLNYPATRAALEAGKHVMVEKPLAANLRQARQMLALERRFPGVKLLAENFRYRPLFTRLKQLIDEGRIGAPYGVIWNIFLHVDAKYNPYARTEWRIHHQYPGGFVTDGGVHNVAALRLLFGEIVSGQARARSINPAIGEVDLFWMVFSTDRGVSGQLNLHYSAIGYADDSLYVFGDRGSLVVKSGEIALKQDGFTEQRERIPDDNGFCEQFADFYRAIREGQAVKSTFQEGYRDLKTILAALKSARGGRKFIVNEEIN
ncbi:MAG: Gfo/Idh/MocA family oxidoreductase [Calditrichaceae bacterium]|nr:Gfo/Idh/MocA family oxidoreductase [Calditrichia bacterium]NUQ42176.1 Gfo/Idh/MocA family oxidoreductase [Calditrichaceae bacterium]